MSKSIKACFLPFILVFVTACSGNRELAKPLSFPADMNNPFLISKHTLGEKPKARKGILGKVKTMLFGPQTFVQLIRPVAIAFQGSDVVLVADADAAKILRYEFVEDKLQSVESFGGDRLISPHGIVVWQDMIYVSDAGSGQILRFDESMQFVDTLKIKGLKRPGQLKVNPQNNDLLIVDTKAHHVLVLNAAGEIVANIQEIGQQILGAPLAVDFMQDGRIAILDGLSRRVEYYTADYLHDGGFGGYDRVPGSFSNPRGLTVSSDGYIFVSDAAFGNIQIFDSRGALLYFFGETGKAVGEFMLPAALGFDDDDNLYVVDQYNNRIQVFHYFSQGG